MESLFLGLSLINIIITFIICVRELYINYYNPLPKFDDYDKSLNEIAFIKSRKI